MRFYNQPHAFYAGVDLHARSMFTHGNSQRPDPYSWRRLGLTTRGDPPYLNQPGAVAEDSQRVKKKRLVHIREHAMGCYRRGSQNLPLRLVS
jgi:hypothetical protein